MAHYYLMKDNELLALKAKLEQSPNMTGFVVRIGEEYVRLSYSRGRVLRIKMYGPWVRTDVFKATQFRPKEVPSLEADKGFKSLAYNLALQEELDKVAKELLRRGKKLS